MSSRPKQAEVAPHMFLPGSETGIYHIIVCNLNFNTTWQQLKDFTRQACDVLHVKVFSQSTHGWVRVQGEDNFDKALKQLNGGILNDFALIADGRNKDKVVWLKDSVGQHSISCEGVHSSSSEGAPSGTGAYESWDCWDGVYPAEWTAQNGFTGPTPDYMAPIASYAPYENGPPIPAVFPGCDYRPPAAMRPTAPPFVPPFHGVANQDEYHAAMQASWFPGAGDGNGYAAVPCGGAYIDTQSHAGHGPKPAFSRRHWTNSNGGPYPSNATRNKSGSRRDKRTFGNKESHRKRSSFSNQDNYGPWASRGSSTFGSAPWSAATSGDNPAFAMHTGLNTGPALPGHRALSRIWYGAPHYKTEAEQEDESNERETDKDSRRPIVIANGSSGEGRQAGTASGKSG